MLHYIVVFIVYFGCLFFIAELTVWFKQNKQNHIKRMKWLQNWKQVQDQLRVSFLLNLKKEI